MASPHKHILLIDDDRDDAELFTDAINELAINASVAHFSNGNEGLEKLREMEIPTPDMIFLDINMPHINGWDCLREIKTIAHLRKIPIVMYSTFNFDPQGIEAKDIGANAFLTKPSHFGELKANLASVIKMFLPA
jgi:CheY-like chemotaxis protein